jgi:hypothetical protein
VKSRRPHLRAGGRAECCSEAVRRWNVLVRLLVGVLSVNGDLEVSGSNFLVGLLRGVMNVSCDVGMCG